MSAGRSGVGSGGLLTLKNSRVSGNQALGVGGGIYFYNGGALLVQNSSISGNTAQQTLINAYFASARVVGPSRAERTWRRGTGAGCPVQPPRR